MIDKEINFQKILNDAKNGDIEDLYNATKNEAFFIARAITSNNQLAEEACQDAYVRIFKSINTLKDDNKFIPWYRQIVRNCAKDILRYEKEVPDSKNNKQNVDISDMYDIGDETIDNNPEMVADKKQKQEIILEIIDSLPYDQKNVVMMHFYEDMKLKDIASELNVSESTVKSRLNYAKTKIKDKIIEIYKKYDIKMFSFAPIFYFRLLMNNYKKAIVPVNIAACKFDADRLKSNNNAFKNITKANKGSKGIINSAIKGISGASNVFKIAIASVCTISVVTGGVAISNVYNDQNAKEANNENINDEYIVNNNENTTTITIIFDEEVNNNPARHFIYPSVGYNNSTTIDEILDNHYAIDCNNTCKYYQDNFYVLKNENTIVINDFPAGEYTFTWFRDREDGVILSETYYDNIKIEENKDNVFNFSTVKAAGTDTTSATITFENGINHDESIYIIYPYTGNVDDESIYSVFESGRAIQCNDACIYKPNHYYILEGTNNLTINDIPSGEYTFAWLAKSAPGDNFNGGIYKENIKIEEDKNNIVSFGYTDEELYDEFSRYQSIFEEVSSTYDPDKDIYFIDLHVDFINGKPKKMYLKYATRYNERLSEYCYYELELNDNDYSIHLENRETDLDRGYIPYSKLPSISEMLSTSYTRVRQVNGATLISVGCKNDTQDIITEIGIQNPTNSNVYKIYYDRDMKITRFTDSYALDYLLSEKLQNE